MDMPKLGQWCIVKGRAFKATEQLSKTYRSGKEYVYATKTTWTRDEYPPQSMMFIGKRTVQEGEYGDHGGFDGESYEEAIYFHPSRYLEVWLFVLSAHRNPIYVFPEDVEFESEAA